MTPGLSYRGTHAKHVQQQGAKWDEVKVAWRWMHNEELYGAVFLTNIIWVMKSWRMRWDGHVACMGREKVHTGFWWGNLRERGHLEDLNIDGSIILKMYLQELRWRAWSWFKCLMIWTGGRLFHMQKWTWHINLLVCVHKDKNVYFAIKMFIGTLQLIMSHMLI